MRAASLVVLLLGAAIVAVGMLLRTGVVAGMLELRAPRRDRGLGWIAFGTGMAGAGAMGLLR